MADYERYYWPSSYDKKALSADYYPFYAYSGTAFYPADNTGTMASDFVPYVEITPKDDGFIQLKKVDDISPSSDSSGGKAQSKVKSGNVSNSNTSTDNEDNLASQFREKFKTFILKTENEIWILLAILLILVVCYVLHSKGVF